MRKWFLKSVGVPLANRLAGRRFWAIYREAVARESATPAARGVYRAQRLADTLRFAIEHVPYWRQQLNRPGVKAALEASDPATLPDLLAALPVTGKDVYKAHYPNRITREGPRDGWRFLSSSGTVDRLTIVTDGEKRDCLAAQLLWVNRAATGHAAGVRCVEIPPQCCNVLCGLPERKERLPDLARHMWRAARKGGPIRTPETMALVRGCFRQTVLPRRTLLPIDPLPDEALTDTVDARIAEIRAERPETIRALPVYLLWIAERLHERRLALPGLKAVLPWGGLASPAMRRRIERGFGAPFRDVYGATELGELAVSCGQGGALHCLEDWSLIELLDDRGAPVPPGRLGRVTVTDFTNRAMPMIRYQLGDIAEAIEGPCPCGNPGRRIAVRGRLHETLPRKGLPPVTTHDLMELFFQQDDVMNFRVDETAPGLYRATVVLRREAGDLEASLGHALGDLLRADRPPPVRRVEFIRPEESGKYRFAHPVNARNATLTRD